MPEVLPYQSAPIPTPQGTRAQRIAWVLYDCGNSGYGLIILGPMFAPYFLREVLPLLPGETSTHGLALLGRAFSGDAVFAVLTAMGALLTAILAPVLGAVADIKGWTKRLFVGFALSGSLLAMTAALVGPGTWVWASVMFVLSSFCFSTSLTFYNAFLPVIAKPEKQGSLSGYGFAFGYIGGALALVVAGFVVLPWLGMRLALGFSGVWWLLFSLPAFFLLKETAPQREAADRGLLLSAGFRRVRATFANIRQYQMLFLFVLAFLLYSNGTDTVINISPAYAASVIQPPISETALVKIFLLVQGVAFLGAMFFGWLSDRIGDKRVIVMTLAGWVIAVGAVFFVETTRDFTFAAIGVGIVLGGVQASSRSLMARLAPAHIRNEAFGFFSLAGKAVSVIGPLCYAMLSSAFGTRMGVLAVLPFLVAGLILVLRVRAPHERAQAQ